MNTQEERMKGKEQNNGIRMVLFYMTCAAAVALTLFAGLLFTKSHIIAGVAHNDIAELQDAINYGKVNNSIRGQMPGIMDNVVKDPNDKYSSSAIIESDHPNVDVTPENTVDLLIKTGIASKAADGTVSLNDFERTRETTSYSRISYKFISKANKDDSFTAVIAKDGSLLVWKFTAINLSDSLLKKLLK